MNFLKIALILLTKWLLGAYNICVYSGCISALNEAFTKRASLGSDQDS